MARRYVALWFCHLTTDWFIRRQPALKEVPFVLTAPDRGRILVKAVSIAAYANGIETGMVVADCRAILPALQAFDDQPDLAARLLNNLAEWCLRYTPVAAVALPDGLVLDISGCAHLWGGEYFYLNDLAGRLRAFGYQIRAAMADTIGTAWAVAHFGKNNSIIEPGLQLEALLPLPPAALRLEEPVLAQLEKLGLYQVGQFINMPRSALRRRFGAQLLTRMDQAMGVAPEVIHPVKPIIPYQERLPSMEPIRTAKGIEIALSRLLEILCARLSKEGKGLRSAVFKAYRTDGLVQQIAIGTNHASRNAGHLFSLFELKINTMEPALGFELFILEAPLVEERIIEQEALWETDSTHEAIASLLDRLAAKIGMNNIHRYLPQEHYWPERSVKLATSLQEQPTTDWRTGIARPVHLLSKPELIEVTVPIPDYPPMLFRYKDQVHQVRKADGPERIEQEWWLEQGEHRDYYCVEDDGGARYWIFRLGHYATGEPLWYLHGFFA